MRNKFEGIDVSDGIKKRKTKQISRRRAIQGMGVAILAPLTPGCTAKDEDSGEETDSWTGMSFARLREHIDTVVVLMMENRSFDHYFGSLSLLEGRTDVEGLRSEMSNPHPDGGDVLVFPSEVFCLPDPPHSSWFFILETLHISARSILVRFSRPTLERNNAGATSEDRFRSTPRQTVQRTY